MADKATRSVEEIGGAKREHFRINDTLPFHFERPGEYAELENDLHIPTDLGLAITDLEGKGLADSLADVLRNIDDKLSYMMSILNQSEEGHLAPPLHDVNVSASGVSFLSDAPLDIGETLKLTLGLPPRPYNLIHILGSVTRVEEKKQDKMVFYEIGISFKHVKAETSQEITKYLFDVQRRRVSKKGKRKKKE